MHKNIILYCKRFFVVNIVFAMLVNLGGLAQGKANDDPLEQIKGKVEEILTILKDEKLAAPENKAERKKQVEAVVDSMFDFEEMAKRSLSRYWDERTPAQKKEFVDFYARLVKQRYIGKIDSYSGQQVVFKKQIIKKKSAIIYSLLVDNGTNIPIDYKLINKGDSWQTYDLRVENVSLATNYRRDFFSIIKSDGYEGLLAKMKEKIEKLESGQ